MNAGPGGCRYAGNVAAVNIHDLRHSVVSNALDAGFTLPEAARLARHASPAVTAAVYSGLLEGRETELATKLVAGGFGS
jgi:integrase